jgi:hypothetical protein
MGRSRVPFGSAPKTFAVGKSDAEISRLMKRRKPDVCVLSARASCLRAAAVKKIKFIKLINKKEKSSRTGTRGILPRVFPPHAWRQWDQKKKKTESQHAS